MALAINTIHNLDALEFLKQLDAESVNCIVTSPPYFGLRDYGVEGQIGLEETPAAYIAKLVELFREARRVLRKDGTCWLNLGDSYATSNSGDVADPFAKSGLGKASLSTQTEARRNHVTRVQPQWGLPEKNLLLMPHRVAIALQDDGWIVRSDIVWSKPNPMPESVTDRPTKAHEYVFLLAKSGKYWYDADAIREHSVYAEHHNRYHTKKSGRVENNKNATNLAGDNGGLRGLMNEVNPNGRNKRSVWEVNSEPTPFAHFATFPQALIEPMILAGCPKQVCAACGKPYVREVSKEVFQHGGNRNSQNGKGVDAMNRRGLYPRASISVNTLGFHPACTCNTTETRAGVVLDMFMGSGTTALVARRLGRDFIGCELNPEYHQLALTRLAHTSKDELQAALTGKPTTARMFE